MLFLERRIKNKMSKRKFNEIERSEDSEEIEKEPPLKKTKSGYQNGHFQVSKALRKQKIISVYDDDLLYKLQKFYDQIVENTKYLKLCEAICANIAIFASGEWLDCCKDGCNEQVSFIKTTPYGDPQKCIVCKTDNYWWKCYKHNREMTVKRRDGPYCNDCNSQICWDLSVKCKRRICKKLTCWHCVDDKGYCKKCHAALVRYNDILRNDQDFVNPHFID